MLRLALVGLVLAALAAVFGFGLVAGIVYDSARILCVVFLILTVLAVVLGLQRTPVDYF